MKKRFIDYIIMSTISGLVNKPIENKLKSSLLKTVFAHSDEAMVNLLSPNAGTVRKRKNLASRLERLIEVRDSINEHNKLVLGHID